MARKTAKDYRKEYNELNKQLNALNARIRAGLINYAQTHPETAVAIRKTYLNSKTDFAEYSRLVIKDTPIEECLTILESMETELAKKNRYKQTRIEGF
jgi:hypothetical protein